MNTGFTFDRDATQRIAKVVRKSEHAGMKLRSGDGVLNGAEPHTAIVKPTSTTVATDGTNYFVPGVVLTGLGDTSTPPAPFPAPSPPTVPLPPGYVTPNAGQFSANTQDCWISVVSATSSLPLEPMPAILNGFWQDVSTDPYLPVFTPTPSGALSLLDKIGATVDTACVFLQMDTSGVITTTNVSPGYDQLAVIDASPTQRGVVNNGGQTFGGDKIFVSASLSVQDTATSPSYIEVLQPLYQFPNGSGTYFPSLHGGRSVDSPTGISLILDTLHNRLGVVASKVSISTDGGGSVHDGATGTFTTADTPAKTVTVTGGFITSIA